MASMHKRLGVVGFHVVGRGGGPMMHMVNVGGLRNNYQFRKAVYETLARLPHDRRIMLVRPASGKWEHGEELLHVPVSGREKTPVRLNEVNIRPGDISDPAGIEPKVWKAMRDGRMDMYLGTLDADTRPETHLGSSELLARRMQFAYDILRRGAGKL